MVKYKNNLHITTYLLHEKTVRNYFAIKKISRSLKMRKRQKKTDQEKEKSLVI